MPESRSDRHLEDPANLGAPQPSSLSHRASRYYDRYRRSFGRESSRMVVMSIASGFLFIVFILALGSIIRG